MARIVLFLSLFFLVSVHAQTIMFNGLTYSVVKSPITQKEWLDRNLGASKLCSSKYDTPCFGDYYQWGRTADGHEKFDSKVVQKNKPSGFTGKEFISVKTNESFDWRKSQNDNLWSLQNICPKGFRVPTIDELSAELNGRNNFLKIPLAGYKSFCNGKLVKQKRQASLWSITPYEKDAYYIERRNGMTESSTASRADALSVRCIRQ